MQKKFFPYILRKLREDNKITLEELALDLGISKSLLWDIEKGRRRVHSELLKTIADYFNITTDYLLGRSSIMYLNELNLDSNSYNKILKNTYPRILELVEQASKLSEDLQELLAHHWEWALDIVLQHDKYYDSEYNINNLVAERKDKKYNPDLEKLIPRNEVNLVNAINKISVIIAEHNLKKEDITHLMQKTIDYYNKP
ncbi:MAG: helix-turn-helix transcriptional regulator [Clostridiales bacterium]|nr:helix-turn-helix transcriptional regulator [Clostridiales bacterium]MCF8022951.1 helix-turn-helix transcriptional regulator [Clostridiales bacterium]